MTAPTAPDITVAAHERGRGLGIAAFCLTLVGALVFIVGVAIYLAAAGSGGMTSTEAASVCRIGVTAGLLMDLVGVIGGGIAVASKRGTLFGAAAFGFGLCILLFLGGGLLLFRLSAG